MDECYLRSSAHRSLELLEKQFPKMAKRVREELKNLPETTTADGLTQPVPTMPGYLARRVISKEAEEAEDAWKAPPLKEPSTAVAPDYAIIYKPLSWKGQQEFGARRLVRYIMSGNDAATRLTVQFPL
jgi:hypothetical protein